MPTKHTDLDYVLRAHVAPGYRAAADLLTRHDEDSDFASDACVLKEGVDPATGRRYLEEIAFEVVSEQNERDVTEKAVADAPPRRAADLRGLRQGPRGSASGPRRAGAGARWMPARGSRIPAWWRRWPWRLCSMPPWPTTPWSEALVAKGNPVIRKREAAAEARGRGEGKAEGRAEGMPSPFSRSWRRAGSP